ncbi:MAG: helix-turn-helix domain-containing protein [Pyrinomonadaceae bacterium]
MSAAVLEHQKMRLVSGGDAGNSQEEAALGSKIRALKEIAQVLIKELEALGDAQPAEAKRSINLQEEVRGFEIDLIRRALKRTGGNQVRAARLLGVKVTTLNSKIIRYGINPDEVAGNVREPLPQANVSALEHV